MKRINTAVTDVLLLYPPGSLSSAFLLFYLYRNAGIQLISDHFITKLIKTFFGKVFFGDEFQLQYVVILEIQR